jgi:hypothetical protein
MERGSPALEKTMPDIRIKSTGQTFYQVDNLIAQLFCAALPDVVERVVPPPPAPKKAEWSVGTSYFGDKVVLWLKTPGGESVPYNGSPEGAEKFYAQNYKHCLPIPPAVLQLYAARRPRPQDAAQAERERLAREQSAAAAAEQNHGQLWTYPSNR